MTSHELPTRTTNPPHDPEPRVKHVRSHGIWEGRMRTRLAVRDFAPFYTAEPERLGGDNTAPTPMEYVIAAFNGCLAIVIELAADERGLTIRGMEINSEGTIDQRGLLGTANVSPHFSQITCRITFQTEAGESSLTELMGIVRRRCPAYNLLNDADIPIELQWEAAEAST